jgi:hypothetical protein
MTAPALRRLLPHVDEFRRLREEPTAAPGLA